MHERDEWVRAEQPVQLTVVVAPDCPTCAEARTIAHDMRERFPALQVEVLDLDGRRPAPPHVVATPTYLLDGQMIALGNPRRETLARRIVEHQARREADAAAAGGDAANAGKPGVWRRQSVLAGFASAVLASFCCLPMATALALGLSLSTAATLGRLLVFQRYFELAGVAAAGLASWWLVRQSRATRRLVRRDHVPFYVFGAFAAGFAVLNLGVIPFLERLPELLAGR